MKISRRMSKWLLSITFVLSLGMMNIDTNQPYSSILPQAYLSSGFKSLSMMSVGMNKSNAAPTILDASQQNMVRFLYMLINGPGTNGYPSGTDGPSDGLLGIIRDIMGDTKLGGALTNAGYNCDSIPTTGNVTLEDGGTFLMVFGTPITTIPTGYTGADGSTTFDKRVTVQYNSTTFMNIEFNCTTAGSLGWMRFDEPVFDGSVPRKIEMYWDTISSTAVKFEMYMYHEEGAADTTYGNEYFTAKFETESDGKYKFWITRSNDIDVPGDNGFRIAVYGDPATSIASAYMFYENGTIADTTTAVVGDDNISSAGSDQCLDFTDPTNVVVSGAGCTSLTLSEAGTTLIDAGSGPTIFWAADTTNGLKNMLTTLVDP